MNEMRRNDVEQSDAAGTQKLPLVSVVILNWNGRTFLEKFLPSVTASTYPNIRIIVGDNASTDDSISFLQTNYPQVEIIINKENEGFAKGYNTVLAQVQSDYYVLLNSDVEVTPNWIEPIIDMMESDTTIGACQPKLLSYNNKEEFEYAGASGGWLDNLGYPFSRGRIFDIVEKDEGQYEAVEACFWASGAAMFVRAELFHATGGFDEYFFAHQEEIDFCWRLQLAGYKVYAVPQSVIYHVGGGTLPKGNSQKVFLNFRNNLIMLAKNVPLYKGVLKVPFRMLLDATAAWKGLATGSPGYFWSIAMAHLHFFRWIFAAKRKAVFPIKKHKNVTGWYRGSVVWQHFVKGKTRFSEIVANK